jgi:hypothetical protein
MSSVTAGWIAVMLSGVIEPEAPSALSETVAASVTLRDGKTALGQVVETSSHGPIILYVRRDWAREHLPAWAERWEAAEAPQVKRALAVRRERLTARRRERLGAHKQDAEDRVSAWIDQVLTRIDSGAAARSAVMMVKLAHADVHSVVRPARGSPELLRLAWLSGLPNPEAMKADTLRNALEGRGVDPSPWTPTSIADLLPPSIETDAAWSIRRAATEILYDPHLRYIRYGGLILPEPDQGEPPTPGAGLLALSAMRDLLSDNTTDPLQAQLGEVEGRRRSGAVVTRLEIEPDFSSVTVQIVLWVRLGRARWVPAGSREARVRPEDLGPLDAKGLADDPQVALAFRLVEAIGMGQIEPEIRKRALSLGACTQKALGLAKSAAQNDLSTLAFPIRNVAAPNPH